eukprot:CAMPEP_0119087620 /NCGR_PEP_ID=MMETSP1178-20130426/142372_1 /TAXON_ID=33656 /ORGANISM="unid sp, Strain CCMP2000" /LENGTH=42 /DNA_ID= /DNA_START= /DNA_END= /DNA_ORIENTATION=
MQHTRAQEAVNLVILNKVVQGNKPLPAVWYDTCAQPGLASAT